MVSEHNNLFLQYLIKIGNYFSCCENRLHLGTPLNGILLEKSKALRCRQTGWKFVRNIIPITLAGKAAVCHLVYHK